MTPNACSVAIFSGGSVLVIRRAFAPFKGLWTLPGGRLDPGETPMQCAMREIREETALEIAPPRHVLTQTVGEGALTFTLAVFAVRHPRGTPAMSDEVADWQWCRPDDLPALPTTEGLAEIVENCALALRKAGPWP